MPFEQRPEGLGSIGKYLIKAIRFYDLKNENLTKIVFIIMLSGSLASFFMPLPSTDRIYAVSLVISFGISLVVNLSIALYTFAFIKELKGQQYTLRECLRAVAAKSLILTAAYIIYYFSTLLATVLLLIIPGVIVYIMFMFYTCFIVDKNRNILEAFKESRKLTDGYKWKIFSILLSFILILFIPLLLVVSIFSVTNNALVQMFVFYFILNIFNLMMQRLIVLMYKDLEYSDEATAN